MRKVIGFLSLSKDKESGNPNGDYWFVGPEDGGGIEAIDLRMKIWEELKAEHYTLL